MWSRGAHAFTQELESVSDLQGSFVPDLIPTASRDSAFFSSKDFNNISFSKSSNTPPPLLYVSRASLHLTATSSQHTGMCVGHAPDGSFGRWGLTMMDAPLLALPDSPSCQQVSKAGAARGVGLHSLDIQPCGGSWTGAVLLALDSQGWLGKGSGRLNRIKGGG